MLRCAEKFNNLRLFLPIELTLFVVLHHWAPHHAICVSPSCNQLRSPLPFSSNSLRAFLCLFAILLFQSQRLLLRFYFHRIHLRSNRRPPTWLLNSSRKEFYLQVHRFADHCNQWWR